MKSFNTEGICNPQKHYMVDISDKISRIFDRYIKPGKYFSVNRGRQYGKTTTLSMLAKRLHEEYYCLQISFEGEDSIFDSEYAMASGLIDMIEREMNLEQMPENLIRRWGSSVNREKPFRDLGNRITELCRESDRAIVLMIDEADRASNNQMMLRFLGVLREKYIQCEKGRDCTFHSVILCGVYDIRNLRMKLRPDEEHRYNSPWNIAAEFDEDLSFSANEIAGMLQEYESDHNTGMDIRFLSEQIYEYTSGYPVLVSGICKNMDERTAGTGRVCNPASAWTREGVSEAVRIIEHTKTPLFEDMVKQLEDYPDLKEVLRNILFEGISIPFNVYNKH